MTSKLVVCCFATNITSGAQNMIRTLKMLGWNFEIIGLGLAWTGWQIRMRTYTEFARSQTDPNTVIVFIDCYDALAVRTPDGFLEKFIKFNADVVIGADMHYNLQNGQAVEKYWQSLKQKPQDETYRYVNAGFLVGKAFALAAIYDWALANGETDDQKAVCHYMNQVTSQNIKLDSDKILGFNDSTDSMRQKPKYTFRENAQIDIVAANGSNIAPYFIHFPGFLIYPTLLFFVKVPPKSAINNYTAVAKHILKNKFVEIGQIDSRAQKIRVMLFWVFVTSIVLLFLLLVLTNGMHFARFRLYKKKQHHPL